jgi:hypothetical protein
MYKTDGGFTGWPPLTGICQNSESDLAVVKRPRHSEMIEKMEPPAGVEPATC